MLLPVLVLAAQAFPNIGGTLVVANQQSHTASLVSLKDGHTVATVETGVGPHEAAVSPDGKTAVVTQYGDKEHIGSNLVVIDIPSAKIVKTVSTGDATRPHGVAFLDNDTVIATSETTQRLVVVNLKAEKLERSLRTDQIGTHLFALPKDHKYAYAANIGSGTVTKFDLATGQKLGQLSVGHVSEAIGVSPDGRWVVTGNRGDENLSLVDAEKMSKEKTLPAPGIPYRIAFAPVERRFFVCNPGAGGLMAFDLERLDAPKTIKIDGAPGGIAIDPEGRYAFVTVLNKGEVAIVDLRTDAVVATAKVGQSPDGIAYSHLDSKSEEGSPSGENDIELYQL